MYAQSARKCDLEEVSRLRKEKGEKEKEVEKLKTEKTELETTKEQHEKEIETLKKQVGVLTAENKQLRAEWRHTCRIIKVLEWSWFWAQWYEINPQYMGTFEIVESARKFAHGIHKDLIASQCITYGNAFIAGYYWDKDGNPGNFYYNPDAVTTAKFRVKYKRKIMFNFHMY